MDQGRGWSFVRLGLYRLYDENELTSAREAGGFARDAISVQALPVARRVTGLLASATA
jgi:hypothetical protein